MVARVAAEGELKITGVACDTLYGRSVWRRRKLARQGLLYVAEAPVNTEVYVTAPEVVWEGRKKQRQVVRGALGMEVRDLGSDWGSGSGCRCGPPSGGTGVMSFAQCGCRPWGARSRRGKRKG
jgi:hypothetical protein